MTSELRPFSVTIGTLEVKGLKGGAGTPLLLLHGGGSRASHFSGLMDLLSPSLHAIAYDQRGFGATGARPEDEISHRAWRDDVVAVLDHFEIESATVCGWSMGAAVALNAAAQYPSRIREVILLGAPRPDRPVNRAAFQPRLDMVARGASAAEVGAASFAGAERGFSPWTRAHRVEAIDAVRQEHLAQNAALLPRIVAGYASRPDFAEILPRVMAPVHLIVGADDSVCDESAARMMQQRLSGATLTTVPNCGHYYAVEQPKALAELILSRFLSIRDH